MAMCIVHVDDLLITYSPKYNVTKLQAAFEWGSWSYYPEEIVYCGQEIRKIDSTRLKVVQVEFLNATPPKNLGRERRRAGTEDLTAEEITEFKSVIVSLQGGSGRTRPDLSASTSLLQHKDLKLEDLRNAYTVLAYARETKDTGIVSWSESSTP